MGDSPSSKSNLNIPNPHEYTHGGGGRAVRGCPFPSPNFLLLFILFTFSGGSLSSSFLVASEQAPVASPNSKTNPPTIIILNHPPITSATTPTHKLRLDLILIGGVGSFFFFVMACFTCFRFIQMKRKRSLERVAAHYDVDEEGGGSDHGLSVSQPGLPKEYSSVRTYTWADLENLTSNFATVIGSGGFSTVYLAQFPDSTLGAVKIHSNSERLNQLYKQELEILLRLQHDNVVKFLGYCDDREEGVLVFEYVPNGNLQEKLHVGGGPVLSWKSRAAIAFQLAQAIEYLHDKCPLQIVHGDIKSSNILLDQQLNCKLCDFGSAKMGFSSTVLPPSCSTRANRMMMLGSPGYTDPHYLRTGIASKKNDVYSFGVILLELITGMEALCSRSGETQKLTSIAGPMLKDDASKLVEMLDQGIQLSDLEEVKAMASISAMCLCDSPSLRPCASDIVRTMRAKIPSLSLLDSFS